MDPRVRSISSRRARSLALVVIGVFVGALMLSPAWAGPQDPATKGFVKKQVKKAKQAAAKGDAALQKQIDGLGVQTKIAVAKGTLPGAGGATASAQADCPAGYQVVGGGHEGTPASNAAVMLSSAVVGGGTVGALSTGEHPAGTGWKVTLFNGSATEVSFTVFAVCAKT